MDANLELIRTKATVRYLAENLDMANAESLLRELRETVTFLERRTARARLVLEAEAQRQLNVAAGRKTLVLKPESVVKYVDGTNEWRDDSLTN